MIKFLNPLIILFHLILFILCLIVKKFDFIPYFIFSGSFCLLLILSFKKNQFKSILFLGIMLWLGFYFKISAHSIFGYGYIEPIGNFNDKSAEWNDVFFISSIGIWGFMASSYSFKFFLSLFPTISNKRTAFAINNDFLYIGLPLLIFAVFCATINLKLEMTMSGLAPKTILPFHINAIIGWFLYQGLIILACIYSQIELDSKNEISKGFALSTIIAALNSISILSRGLFLFQILPFLESIRSNNQHKFSKFKLIKYSIIFVISLVIVSTVSNTVRNNFYDQILQDQNKSQDKSKYGTKYLLLLEKSFGQISGLVIDRWIGAEGLMATSTYKDRNLSLMTTTFMRKLKPGDIDIYSEISNSYKNSDKKYFFTSLPGIISFLYYSNSYLIVFAGMFFIGFIFRLIENIVEYHFSNIFLTSQIGFYLANGIAQFGISPRPLFINFFMTFTFLFFLYLIQRIYKLVLLSKL